MLEYSSNIHVIGVGNMRFPGGWELLTVLVIVLVIFGASRLPGVGTALGKGMRNFRQSVTGKESTTNDDTETNVEEKD